VEEEGANRRTVGEWRWSSDCVTSPEALKIDALHIQSRAQSLSEPRILFFKINHILL
jgi:hypothetical protein